MSESAADTGRFSVRFPEVILGPLRRPEALVAVTLPDVRAPLEGHFSSPSEVWAFEAALRQPDNLANPNRFTFGNWAAVRQLGLDLEWEAVEPLVGRPPAGLEAIPTEADLFRDWTMLEASLLDLVDRLTEEYGLRLGEATALLYQKRPFLFPIFDRETRQALNVPARPASRRDALRRAFSRFLAVAETSTNKAALDRTMEWLALRPPATRLLVLSRARVMNLAAIAAAQEAGARSGPADENRPDEGDPDE